MLSDKMLEAKVNSALEDHVSLAMAPAGIIVSASNGRVTLAGVTSSGSLRAKAERVTQSIAGVYAIENRIVSVPNRGRPQPDNGIPSI
jgi:osmotically-inducible protein OsmY